MKKLLFIFVLVLPFTSVAQEELEWISFVEAAQRNSKKPKKFFIDVYTDWCGWCKKMDAATFHHPEIAKYLNENFYTVKLDAEMTDVIVFNGDTMALVQGYGRKGTHELALRLMNGRASYPTIVYLDENLGMIKPDPGYKSPEQLEPILKYYASNAYKEKTWEEYMDNFESELKSETPH